MFGKKIKGPWSDQLDKYLNQSIGLVCIDILNLFDKEIPPKTRKKLDSLLTTLVIGTANMTWNACENQKNGPLGHIESPSNGIYSPFMSYKSTTKIPTESLNKIIKKFLEDEGFYEFKENMEERFKKAAKSMPKSSNYNKPNGITR